MTRRLETELFSPARLQPLVAAAEAGRHGLLRTWLHRRLRLFFPDFDVNAWLGMYPMSYLTTDEWRDLVPARGGRLIDVGAGSGDLTESLAPLFDEVICTETSRGMARRLARRGFAVRRDDLTDKAPSALGGADAIALLHVLDRCRAPSALYRSALALLRPGGLVLVAVPLPYRPLVDRGRRCVAPDERLVAPGLEVDAERAALERALFAEPGLELLVTARVPYLCPGDAETPHYLLESRLFVARRR